jgi:phosphate:Na+ symporter
MVGVIILDLMGGVALLLWGLHMVQSGVLRAFGADLRLVLGRALRNPHGARRMRQLDNGHTASA